MTPAQRNRVRALFEELVDLPPGDVWERLEAASEPAIVKDEVRSLLEHHARAGFFLTAPASAASLEHELAPGMRLDRYTVVREIGRGGMGRVYLAVDERLGRQVCLKAVREELGDPAFRRRLQHEARTAASLSHPGICAVYALEEFDDRLYIVTEFIDGHTLRDEIDDAPRADRARVRDTLRQLAAAVAAAHARGVTHRDLKPENVMRTAEGRLKVLDFGLARVEAADGMAPGVRHTLPGVVVGTPGYMAPEQIDGGPIDARTDVFALGVLAYEFAAGVHPFAAATPLAIASRVLGDDRPSLGGPRADLPASLVAVVDRCLARHPAQRFPSAAAMAVALEEDHDEAAAPPRRRLAWWRIHQLALIAVYATGTTAAWQIHTWEASTAARWDFLLMGMLAAVNGVVRGHLLFTERTHPERLAGERRRSRTAALVIDLAMAVALAAAASLVSGGHPVVAALVIGLAAGLATAALLIEPSTSNATIGVP